MFCTKEWLRARQYTNFLGDHEYKVFSYDCGVHGVVHYTLYLMSDPVETLVLFSRELMFRLGKHQTRG